MRDGAALRFVQNVASTCHDDECLQWPYTRGAKGYGQVQCEGRHVLAHRMVCELAHGEPPSPKHEATHDCGNPICVNPLHLSWKTHAGNMADKLVHGTSLRGEQNSQVKLTESEVREIVALKGTMSQREIGNTFGVDQSLISRIYNGSVWGWLTGVASC